MLQYRVCSGCQWLRGTLIPILGAWILFHGKCPSQCHFVHHRLPWDWTLPFVVRSQHTTDDRGSNITIAIIIIIIIIILRASVIAIINVWVRKQELIFWTAIDSSGWHEVYFINSVLLLLLLLVLPRIVASHVLTTTWFTGLNCTWFAIFEVLTAASMKMAVFCIVAPCSLVEVYRHFRGACCLHHQGDESWWRRLQAPLKRQ
jgi:hypothetical protein